MPDTRSPQQIVDSLRIASPCEVPWSSMAGDDRMRHCAQCDCKVYNAARLSAEEVVDLIQSSERMPCLQLWRRADGTVITTDCPVGRRRLRARRRVALAAGLTVVLAACGRAGRVSLPTVTGGPMIVDGCFPEPPNRKCAPDPQVKPRPERRPHPLMGKVKAHVQPPLMGAPPPKAEDPK